jgi:hypothetical protein
MLCLKRSRAARKRLSREFSFLGCYSCSTNDGLCAVVLHWKLAVSIALPFSRALKTVTPSHDGIHAESPQSPVTIRPPRQLNPAHLHLPDHTPSARLQRHLSSCHPAPTRRHAQSRQKSSPAPGHKTRRGTVALHGRVPETALHSRWSSAPSPGGWPIAQLVPGRPPRAVQVDTAANWRRRWCSCARRLARWVCLETMMKV